MTVASRPVLVTGAAGFLGGAVMSRLRKVGRDVVGLDLKEDSARGIRGCDLSRSEELRLAVADLEIDSVVHCGAISGPMLHRDEPAFVAGTNINSTLNLLELARGHAARRFVFCSSGSVYGTRNPMLPVSEETPLHPTSAYAASKVAGEALVEAYHTAYGLEGVSLRIAAIYGPGRNTACHIRDMLAGALAGRRVEVAYGYDQRFHFLHVDDAATAVIAALMTARVARPSYTIAGDNGVTLGALADLIRRSAPDAEIEVKHGIDPLSDIQGPYDLSAAATDLGWRPAITLEEGIRTYAEWLKTTIQNY
jgi:UDP-glucuronate 4-epimerase